MKPFITIQFKHWVAYGLIAFSLALFLVFEDYLEGDVMNPNEMFLDLVFDTGKFTIICFGLGMPVSILVQWMNKELPWGKRNAIRILAEIGIVVSLVAVSCFVFLLVSYLFGLQLKYAHKSDELLNYESITVIMFSLAFLLLFLFHEIAFLWVERENFKLQTERLEKQNALSRYEALKNQVNPHFLFNSLNVLSTLVYKDARQADLFIREFSKVFRYVLELNQEAVVTVEKEVQFLHSFLYLQKIRFGENLTFKESLSVEALKKLIPPMSLQLLVENAIKHNVISDDMPLQITLKEVGGRLEIRNTYQIKHQNSSFNGKSNSTGIGLKNLKAKYHLISEEAPTFGVLNGEYVAALPLVEQE